MFSGNITPELKPNVVLVAVNVNGVGEVDG
jgi:hypothetical protein